MPPAAPASAAATTRLEVPRVANAEVAVAQRIASGGDFFDAALTPSGLLMFMMLDISGRNCEALFAPLQKAFRDCAARLFSIGGNDSEALAQLAVDFNRELLRASSGVRCTAGFIGCFDPEVGALWYVNAGHTPAIVHDGECKLLPAGGVPLGLFAYATREAQVYVLQPGAAFAAISKGTVEEEGFELVQAAAVVAEHRSAGAGQICDALLSAARPTKRNKSPQDQTVMVLVRHSS